MTTFVTLQEAADYLGVSKNTLRNWDQSGKLQAQRNPLNGYRQYDMDSLIKLKQNITGTDSVHSESRHVATSNKPSRTYITNEATSRAVRATINRIHDIVRDSSFSSDIMQRFDEISKLLFMKLVVDRSESALVKKDAPVHDNATAIRKHYRVLLERNRIDTFGQSSDILLSDDCLIQCAYELDRIDLSFAGADVKAMAYEEVIKGTFDKSDNQQFFTPPLIVSFMASMFSRYLRGTICDPACGTASFLIAASKINHDASVLGMEIDPRLTWVSQLNLCLHGVPSTSVHLLGDGGSLGKAARPFFASADVILTNPPFGSDYSDSSGLANYELGRGKKSRRRGVLFIEQSWNLLKQHGVVAIIIDQGVLTSSSNYDVRQYILTHFNIMGIVDLPDTAFMPYATVSTSILFLQKRSAYEPRCSKPTFFARAHDVGRRPNGDDDYCYAPDGTARINSDLPLILDLWNSFQEAGSIATTADAYCCDLANEPFENPDNRLDFAFHHPVRLQSIASIKSSLYPMAELGELCAERNQTYIPSADPEASTIMMTGLANIEPMNGHAIQVRTAAASVKSGVKRYEKHDILFAKMRPALRKVALMEYDDGGYASSECVVLTVRKNENDEYLIDPRLLCALLRSDFVYGQIVHLIQGSGRPRISNKNIRHIKVPIAPKAIQMDIVSRIASQTKVVEQMRADAETLLREATTLEKSSLNDAVDEMLGANND